MPWRFLYKTIKSQWERSLWHTEQIIIIIMPLKPYD